MPEMDDRDLDALIAVKLFGWRWYWPGPGWVAHFAPPDAFAKWSSNAELLESPPKNVKLNDDAFDVPRYSESWRAMRLVVEVMRARGYPRLKMEHSEYKGKWNWVASFWPGEGEPGYFEECVFSFGAHTSESLPKAVCRAALNALETEHKEEV